ncbi:DNA-3-methyladenine glycosylase I [Acetobacter indonesiensis]
MALFPVIGGVLTVNAAFCRVKERIIRSFSHEFSGNRFSKKQFSLCDGISPTEADFSGSIIMNALHRCQWAQHDPIMQNYHDCEWGVPVRDSRALWEKLILDGFQAGLSWRTILFKAGCLSGSLRRFCS